MNTSMKDLNTDYVLEEMVDAASVSEVLQVLASICFEKSELIQASYDDQQTAREWEKAASMILDLSTKIDV
jgi:hypothetical protein